MDKRISIDAELRASGSGDQYVLEGRAIKYNSLSKSLGGFREKIAPGCFRADLATADHDCVALRDHDPSQILGRESNGTLTLTDSNDGLRFRIQLNPAVQAHRDLHALVKDGTLHECSFAFGVESPDDEEWEKGTDERGKRIAIRTVKRAKLFDVSVVTNPAYGNDATSAQARAEKIVSSEFETTAEALERFAKTSTEKKQAETDLRSAFEKVRLF